MDKQVYKSQNGKEGGSGRFLWVLLFAAVVLVVLGIVFLNGAPAEPANAEPAASEAPLKEEKAPATPEPPPEPLVQTIRLSASGDNLIHNGIYEDAQRRAAADPENPNEYDFSYCYANMVDFYKGFDVNWINQETLVNDEITPSNYPCFSTPGQMANDLYDAGFRVFGLSNNHTYDYGARGIAATMKKWASMPEDAVTCGLYKKDSYDNITYKTTNGITVAYLGYTEMTNGIPTPESSEYRVVYLSEEDIITAQVVEAKKNADFVVVSCHWGNEGSHIVTDTQRYEAQFLADLGVDVILGMHPHFIQDAEWLTGSEGNSTFVVYSLGNYLNYQSSPDNMICLVLGIELEKTTYPDDTVEYAVKSPTLYPVINHYDRGYHNGRMYLLSDYTEELAASHGVRSGHPQFGLDYINSVYDTVISAEFLAK